MKLLSALALFSLVFSPLMAADNPAPPPSAATADGRVTFALRAPNAKAVTLQGQWSKTAIPLTRADNGEWSTTLEQVPAGVWEYSYNVDGLNVLDPTNPSFKPQRQPGKSILHVPANPPALWDWQDVPHGTVHYHPYESKALEHRREIVVYTPPGYEKDTEKKYPLLVLQHGSGDNQRTWVEHGKANLILDNLIAQGKAVPMVVVMLDGHPPGPPQRGGGTESFQRELFEDALPMVEALYRVEKDAAHRAITGLSMGGGQSLATGLSHLDRFAYLGAFSAGIPSGEAMAKIISDPAAVNSALKLFWIGVGKDDFLRKRNEDFTALLKEKGVKFQWELSEGDHSWPVWRTYLTEFVPLLFK